MNVSPTLQTSHTSQNQETASDLMTGKLQTRRKTVRPTKSE